MSIARDARVAHMAGCHRDIDKSGHMRHVLCKYVNLIHVAWDVPRSFCV